MITIYSQDRPRWQFGLLPLPLFERPLGTDAENAARTARRAYWRLPMGQFAARAGDAR